MLYVGVDLHRKRSHVAALDEEGTLLLSQRIDNSPERVPAHLRRARARVPQRRLRTATWCRGTERLNGGTTDDLTSARPS